MDKRTLLKGMIAACIIPAVPSIALASFEEDGIITVYNRIGLPCTYTKELARDAYEIHQLDFRRIFENSYGTTFQIRKTYLEQNSKHYLMFELISNDFRDKSIYWADAISHRW